VPNTKVCAAAAMSTVAANSVASCCYSVPDRGDRVLR